MTSENLKPQHGGAWWEKLPQDQAIKVLVQANVSLPPETPLTTQEARAEAFARHAQAVKTIVDYILGNQESFPGLDEGTMRRIDAVGILALSLTPAQCSQLIESGLVKAIYLDTKINFFPMGNPHS